MSISYPRTLPIIPIKSSRFGLNVNQAVFESSLSRKVTIQNHAAGLTDRWEGVFSTAELSAGQVAELSSWLVSLKGREKTFYAYDPDRRSPIGIASSQTSAPLVKGADQIGNAVLSHGWQASTQGLLMPGDYIQINSGFHMIMEPVNSDALGEAIINFEPVLKTSPADNAPIVFANPVLIARLGVVVDGWETGANKTGVISFSWEEVI